MNTYRYFLALASFLLLLFLPIMARADASDVYISEIGWAGSSLSQSDEWLELTNAGSESVNLSGWYISGAATSGEALYLPEGSVIGPGSTYLISNYDLENEKSTLNVASDYVTASLSLSNSSLQLVLLDATGVLHDRAGGGGSPFFGGVMENGGAQSMLRIYPDIDGSTAEAWGEAGASVGFDEGSLEIGTPGYFDSAIDDLAPLPEMEENPEETDTPANNETSAETENPETEVPAEENLPSFSAGTLTINEFVSDPVSGEPEWVEIYNPGADAVPLAGWTVEEGSGRSVAFPDQELQAGQFAVVEYASGALNNGGDTIYLIDPSGNIVDALAYGTDSVPAVSDPKSVARNSDSDFVETSAPTPGATNVITQDEISDEETGSAEEPPAQEETADEVESGEDAEPAEETISEEDTISDNDSGQTSEEQNLPFFAAGTLIINEFISDPVSGETEWVEIYNLGADAVPLSGWTVQESSGRSVAFPDAMLEAGQYAVVEYSSGALNNGGDTIYLIDPSGNIVDELTYGTDSVPAVSDPHSVTRNDGGEFVETSTPTPGAENLFTQEVDEAEATEPAEEPATQEKTTDNSEAAEPAADGNQDTISDQTDEPENASVETAEEEGETPAAQTGTDGTEESQENQSETTQSEESQNNSGDIEQGQFGIDLASDDDESPNSDSFPAGTLIINEFISDPVSGEPEWVEIYNPGADAVPMAGWTVEEGSGRSVAFPDAMLEAGQYAVVEYSSGALNNGGDTIYLIDPSGNIVDELAYGTGSVPAVSDPNSVARNAAGEFVETSTPTPGAANAIVAETEETVEEETDLETPSVIVTSAASDLTDGDSEAVNQTDDDSTEESASANSIEPSPTTLRLSEIYPNTKEGDAQNEFIEIENFGGAEISLQGWRLEDATGNSWSPQNHLYIAGGELLAIGRPTTGIALNNSGGETLRLYAPDGSLASEISYEKAPQGQAYALFSTVWSWTTTVTRNEPNRLSENVSSSNGNVSAKQASKKQQPADLNLGEVREQEIGAQVLTRGVVSAAPGMLGTQIFYITDTIDGETFGIQIFKSDGEFPEMFVGDLVELSGTISSNRGELRIKISKTDSLAVLGQKSDPVPQSVSYINEGLEGTLAKIQGKVLTKKTDRFVLQVGDKEITVRVKSGADIDLSPVVAGATVEAVGIVSETDKKYALLMRSEDDLTIVELPKTDEELLLGGITGKDAANNRRANIGMILGVLCLAVLGALFLRWFLNKRKQQYENPKLSLSPTS